MKNNTDNFRILNNLTSRANLQADIRSELLIVQLNVNKAIIEIQNNNGTPNDTSISLLNNAAEHLKIAENKWIQFDSIPTRTGHKRQELEDAYKNYHAAISKFLLVIKNNDLNPAI